MAWVGYGFQPLTLETAIGKRHGLNKQLNVDNGYAGLMDR